MKVSSSALTFLLSFGSAIVAASTTSSTTAKVNGNKPIKGLLKKSQIPDTGKEWVSIDKYTQVQPADFSNESPEVRKLMEDAYQRLLWGGGNNGDYQSKFVDGSETFYDDYSQAWRYLGFYIDCNAPAQEDKRRHLNDNDGAGCLRYLMWAAYIDPKYEGGGIGEYSFFDRHENIWDTTSCTAEDGRCAKMDCHLPDTDFKLLGVFKEPKFAEWMEQLFKHEGVCIWTDNEYKFMQQEREVWPEYCTGLHDKDEDGNQIYFDLKPEVGGSLGVGVYTDSSCTIDYEGEKNHHDLVEAYWEEYGDDDAGEAVDDDRGNDNERDRRSGNLLQLDSHLERWNDAFDIFKLCQPCRAYNLGYNEDLNNGDERHGGEDEDGNGDYFTCQDDAGYRNVNQCMKFKTKTKMQVAFTEDIDLASAQGNLQEIDIDGVKFGTNRHYAVYGNPWFGPSLFFAAALAIFGIAGFMFYREYKNMKSNSTMKEPLMDEELIENEKGELA